jgi:hypothetical protein
MNNAIWSVIGLLVLLHGYFLIRYQTYEPCEAAAARFVQDGRAAWPGGSNRDPKALLACYYGALTGDFRPNMAAASPTK